MSSLLDTELILRLVAWIFALLELVLGLYAAAKDSRTQEDTLRSP